MAEIYGKIQKGGRKRFGLFKNFKKAWGEVYPLSRLVNFQTGVAGGVVVCTTDKEVADTLERIVENRMRYDLIQKENVPDIIF